jgi:signal transduction histidine kinase
MIGRFSRSTFGLVVLVALVLAVVTGAIGAIAYEVTHEAIEEQLDHRIAVETAALLAEAHEDGVADLADAIRRRDAARSTASLDYLLVDDAGRKLAGDIEAEAPAQPGYEEFLHYRRAGKTGIAQSLTTLVPGGKLVVAADRGGLKEIDRILATLFAAAFTAMLVVGVGAAALIGGITRRRLARIDATALAIIGGDFHRRVPLDGSNSEFDRLAGTLNRMLDRMAGLMDNLRQVSSDVAHDLRTPLTRLHNSLDRALTEADPAARTAGIEAAREQAGELLDIFAALLRIAEIEGMAERLPRQRLDLSALVEKMAETYRPDMEAAGLHLHRSITPDIGLQGDPRLLSQLLANLLDNALNHTPAGTTVAVSLERLDRAVRIRVADNGPGVAAADESRLFERFARAEQSRSTPGHGLGLALVAAVATAHGGRATLDAETGFSVTIELPSES